MFHDSEALIAKLADASERLASVGEEWLNDCLVRISNLRAWHEFHVSTRKGKKKEILIVLERKKGLLKTSNDTQYVIDHINFCPRLEGRDIQHSLTG